MAGNYNDRAFAPWILPRALNDGECDALEEAARRLPRAAGAVISLPDDYRRCSAASFRRDPEWLYSKIWDIFDAANQVFKFSIIGLNEPVHHFLYGVDDGFDWHSDCGPGLTATRKLSLSIQLSNEYGYEGGDLEFHLPLSCVEVRNRGTAIIFPAFLPHRVTKIVSGERASLVSWACGPTFV